MTKVKHSREAVIAAALAVALALGGFLASAYQAQNYQRAAYADQTAVLARDIARNVTITLRTSVATLDTLARTSMLRGDSTPEAMAQVARLVGEQFDGWFTVSVPQDGQTAQILLDSSLPVAMQAPVMRITPPEVRRAETESLRLGRSAVSDAYEGGTTDAWIVTIATPITAEIAPGAFLHFSVMLDDIAQSLTDAPLAQGDIAIIIDGSHRIIAASVPPDQLAQSRLQNWAQSIALQGSGISQIDDPTADASPMVVAIQQLDIAPNWTLAIARPLPSFLSSAMNTAWPSLLGLSILIITASIANLVMDRRRTQAEMFRAAREAAERERLLDKVKASDARKARLMAVLAHDLRTPLVAMLGLLDLHKTADSQASRAKVIDKMKHDGHGMLQLIDDVLELARLGAGEVRLRPEPFAPATLLEDVATMVRPQATRRDTKITTEIGPVPPMLMGDLAALRRVLLNFTTNAVKATQGGEIRLSVATAASDGSKTPTASPPEIEFSVTDTGCGIDADDIPKLFRDFGMLERDDDTRQGTGLGLAICRRLANAMGGRVGAESTPGAGSRFWLRLPLPPAMDDEKPKPDSADQDPLMALKGLRILVADDHETIRMLTCSSLARCGAYTTEAVDGLDAVALAETQAFDLILMDQNMPNLDGTAAAARIRQGNGPSTQARILCVSAHQTTAIAAMLSDFSLDGFLTKPINLTKLGMMLQERATVPCHTANGADFDPDILSQFRNLDDGALLRRTLTRLAEEITTTRDDLTALIDTNDHTQARRLAHKLAGFCDMLGARSLSRALRDLEQNIETAPPQAQETLLSKVVQEMEHTQQAVQNLTRID